MTNTDATALWLFILIGLAWLFSEPLVDLLCGG